jgi:hypothetical protein
MDSCILHFAVVQRLWSDYFSSSIEAFLFIKAKMKRQLNFSNQEIAVLVFYILHHIFLYLID